MACGILVPPTRDQTCASCIGSLKSSPLVHQESPPKYIFLHEFLNILLQAMDFPGGSEDKESICNAGDLGLIPVTGRSTGEGNGYPLQYSCLENSMDRGAWWATAHGVSKSQA